MLFSAEIFDSPVFSETTVPSIEDSVDVLLDKTLSLLILFAFLPWHPDMQKTANMITKTKSGFLFTYTNPFPAIIIPHCGKIHIISFPYTFPALPV